MKGLFVIILATILCCGMLSGCSNTRSEEPTQTGLLNQISASEETDALSNQTEGSAVPDVQEDGSVENAKSDDPATSAVQTNDIVDLTQLSSTMVYAEVYNMMMSPEEYVGKTIKMDGLYYASYIPDMDVYYHFVVIQDATACCEQGLEFIWNGDHTYPNGYPKDETPVEVTGIWRSLEEDGNTYYYIATDGITVL